MQDDRLFDEIDGFDKPDKEMPVCDKDLLMEQILENINSTPLGQVLRNIASLPEVRQEKILGIRGQITAGQYNLNDRLDVAVDKVLEDLMA